MTKNKLSTTTGNNNTGGRLFGDAISGIEGARRGTAGHSANPSRQDRRQHSPRRPTYLSVRQAAWLLAVPPSVIYRAIRIGTLPAVRRGSRLGVTENGVRCLTFGGAA